MKRSYVKPVIVCENLTTTPYITSCAWDVKNQSNPEDCGALGDVEDYNNPPIRLFGSENICDLSPSDYDSNNGETFCYTVSAEGWTYFHS